MPAKCPLRDMAPRLMHSSARLSGGRQAPVLEERPNIAIATLPDLCRQTSRETTHASSGVMAGVGEASAIVALIGTAATLSKAVVDIASKYKNAGKQIESFGREVGILGNVLDQLHRLHEKDHMEADDGVHSVTMTILGQCAELFSELDTYKDALYSRPGSVRSLTFRGKTKWVFTAAELDYIRTKLESVKTNLLLMMTMQCMHNSDR